MAIFPNFKAREPSTRLANTKRWNRFPLSTGERAGVRASVAPYLQLVFQPDRRYHHAPSTLISGQKSKQIQLNQGKSRIKLTE